LAGDQRAVALVALVAHASFQDRLILALGVTAEPGGPVPPVTAPFGRPEAKPPTGPKAQGPPPVPETEADQGTGAAWLGLQEELEKQRAREGRIRVPSRDEVIRRIGQKHPAAWQADILWSRVCYGNQPELTDAWFDCANAFRQESGLDRLFQNEIFWVVTDSVRCFY
jgi:hypothetical protein